LAETFVNRHVDVSAMRAQKEAFKISNIRYCLERLDPKLANIFKELYNRCTDFGGRPNPNALFSAMRMTREVGTTTIENFALTTDQSSLLHALKTVAQVGLLAAHASRYLFTEKFEQLEIGATLQELANCKLDFGVGL
jgi:hypothetical protein